MTLFVVNHGKILRLSVEHFGNWKNRNAFFIFTDILTVIVNLYNSYNVKIYIKYFTKKNFYMVDLTSTTNCETLIQNRKESKNFLKG